MRPDRRKRFARPPCRVRGRQTSAPPQTHTMGRGPFGAAAAARPHCGLRDPGSDGPGCVRGPAGLLASPAIKPTFGRLSRTVTFRRPVDGPSVCGRSGRRHPHIRRLRSSNARRRLPCGYRCQGGCRDDRPRERSQPPNLTRRYRSLRPADGLLCSATSKNNATRQSDRRLVTLNRNGRPEPTSRSGAFRLAL